uniref:Uncharacterized protein n=1 Tax=Trypanosoma vivax (strain Y486) TaxID=1055687 RepID=G0TVY5_TRYVY|nr:hypothetical protein TVY486_0503020 [Trypanosoma vivax Y486]
MSPSPFSFFLSLCDFVSPIVSAKQSFRYFSPTACKNVRTSCLFEAIIRTKTFHHIIFLLPRSLLPRWALRLPPGFLGCHVARPYGGQGNVAIKITRKLFIR